MNWANHPILYQLVHWWHWLTYGQNASAIQAFAALIAALAAICAGIFAARAYAATLTQLQIARDQFDLARSQAEAARMRFEEERRRTMAAAQARYERMRAEEDSNRPRFKNTGGYVPAGGLQNWEFRNYGASAATEVLVSTSEGTELAKMGLVGAGFNIVFRTTPAILDDGVIFRFKTAFGSRWQIVVRLSGEEEIREVKRIYDPTDDAA